jgi:hypothetical protein
MLRVVRCMLHVVCCVSPVARRLLSGLVHDVCCMLRVACCVLHGVSALQVARLAAARRAAVGHTLRATNLLASPPMADVLHRCHPTANLSNLSFLSVPGCAAWTHARARAYRAYAACPHGSPASACNRFAIACNHFIVAYSSHAAACSSVMPLKCSVAGHCSMLHHTAK